MGKPSQKWHLIIIGVWLTAVLLAACSTNVVVETAVPGEPTLNPTQQAIADILTYQAENPRATRTPDPWIFVFQTATAEAMDRATAVTTRNATQEAAAILTQTAAAGPTATPQPRTANVAIPAGTAPQLDGRFTPGEWDDAARQTITVNNNVKVKIYAQHDDATLYVAFDGLNQGEEALWQQCGTPDGWQTTDFSQSLATIEMQIPYASIGLQPGTDQPIGISWAVMQLSTGDEEVRAFWPATAVIDQPATWAKGTAVGGW
ncbi:MAG: hypothetical protein P8183_04600 [Anaerolineae bacterium]